MNFSLVLPSAVAIAVICLMGLFELRLHPRAAMRTYLAGAIVAGTTAALLVLSIAAGFVLGPSRSEAVIEWCGAVPLHHQIAFVPGIAALAYATVAIARAGRVLALFRRELRAAPSGRLDIRESTELFAYALPTRTGCVVVSTAMLESLTPTERQVLFAHERTHLHQNHHRYLLTAAVCAAFLPPLIPLVRQLQHATELAADEGAASALGDRQLVASAIAHAAMTSSGPAMVSAFGGGSVMRRVETLLTPAIDKRRLRLVAAVASGVMFIAAGSLTVQLHHLLQFFDHIC